MVHVPYVKLISSAEARRGERDPVGDIAERNRSRAMLKDDSRVSPNVGRIVPFIQDEFGSYEGIGGGELLLRRRVRFE